MPEAHGTLDIRRLLVIEISGGKPHRTGITIRRELLGKRGLSGARFANEDAGAVGVKRSADGRDLFVPRQVSGVGVGDLDFDVGGCVSGMPAQRLPISAKVGMISEREL